MPAQQDSVLAELVPLMIISVELCITYSEIYYIFTHINNIFNFKINFISQNFSRIICSFQRD